VRLLLVAVILPFLLFSAASADDQGDYGPDWPVCRNVRGDPNALIVACQRLIESGRLTQQHLSWAYNNVATAWNRLGRLDLVIADLKKSQQIDPTNHAPYFNLGDLLYRLGRYGEALELYDKGIALKPETPSVLCQRGAILEELGRTDEAWADYEKELARDTDNSCALYHYTMLAPRLNRSEKALAALDRALAVNPRDAESYHRRATIHFDLGQFDRALADTTTGLQLNPKDQKERGLRGDIELELGQFDAAIMDLTEALNMDPLDALSYDKRASAYLRRGYYQLAATDCRRREEIGPDHACAGFLWHAAMLLQDFEAAAAAGTLLSDNGDNGGKFLRGLARFAQGRLTEAAADFAAYNSASPDDQYGWLWLYLADRKLGKDDAERLKPIAARRDAWPNILLRHVVGQVSAEEVSAAADVPDPDVKRLREAEADFYLGELAALDGRKGDAAKLWQAGLAMGRTVLNGTKATMVYKMENDLELSLAQAMLHDSAL